MRWGRQRAVVPIIAVAIAGFAAPAPGSAATIISSDLSVAPSFAATANTTYTNNAPPSGSATPVTSPVAGVMVRMRVRHGVVGANPGSYAYRILSGTAPNFTARPATPSGLNERIAWVANSAAGIATYVPTGADGRPVGVPIAAGERLAIWLELASSPDVVAGPPGSSAYFRNVDHISGTQPYTGGLAHMDIQGVVEPDADGDMYGDETQDFCATDPTRQGHCAPPEPEPEPPPPDPPPDNCPANDQRLDDCTAPSIQITSGPKARTAKTKARFEFAADEAASFECALDKGGFLPCTSEKRFRRLKPGRHTFYVRATDANGNASAVVSQRWRVLKPTAR